MAVRGLVHKCALTVRTQQTYGTHVKTYLIWCHHNKLDPLILTPADLADSRSLTTVTKVDMRFADFACWLAGQTSPGNPDKLHYMYSTVVEYANGARNQLTRWFGVNIAHLCDEAMNFTTTKRGLRSILEQLKSVRNPIAPQQLLQFADKMQMVPLSSTDGLTRWVHRADGDILLPSPLAARHVCLGTLNRTMVSQMLLCASVFGWSLLLRVSEFTTRSAVNFNVDQELSRADISFHGSSVSMADLNLGTRGFVPLGHVDVVIKHHKTVRRVGPLLKRAHVSFGGDLCLVSLLIHYLHAGQSPAGTDLSKIPLFRWPDGSPLSAVQLRDWLKGMLGSLGFKADEFNCHSLRKGGATALVAMGANETTVKIMARWLDSKMPELYADATAESVQSFSAAMGRLTTLTALQRTKIRWG